MSERDAPPERQLAMPAIAFTGPVIIMYSMNGGGDMCCHRLGTYCKT